MGKKRKGHSCVKVTVMKDEVEEERQAMCIARH